ncbi:MULTISPECIES: TetR/AcrR family transcriptional regulator [Brevibacterium]|uniref:Transcriptional regulator, TetR family n=2 Tax=Brevibacterium linens TaxID=1703 RepID=A0A2H1ICE2_BRELN|nr:MULTISPECIES: TetR/AcrR family transcriptional regulator [Brevibacterium]MDN5586430.1 TetR/AcrR family transcriptional regulator [Brevibacterium sp.]MDN5604340.1 TetR/AcrR family transcriptional regulator [Kocuria sp.]KAB1946373.1 TetR/AcrR family transcriptional regulator [Brevibacterium linens ATCC 9172]SMX72878.1 transcriptional regulator, TetR family [Brevibacterium linens]SMX95229.1 transcriptional regulator, TetR family [Brevibacterium linens ATCC 9172]
MPRTMDRDARKAQLAEAVWQVILDQGISAVSVRTVAERAGVAVGSLRHVFPTRAELVQFSAELMMERATERLLATTPRDDPREYALAIITNVLPLDSDSRAEYEVNLALLAERAAVPSLQQVSFDAHQQLADLCTRLVEMLTGQAGTPDGAPRARRLHTLIDGLAFHLFHQPAHGDATWALDIIQDELTATAGDANNDGASR